MWIRLHDAGRSTGPTGAPFLNVWSESFTPVICWRSFSRPVAVTCSSFHRGVGPGLADGLRTCPALLSPGLETAPSGNGALYPGDAGLPVQRSRHCLVLSVVTLTLAKVKCQCPPAFSVLLRVGVASKLQERLLTPRWSLIMFSLAVLISFRRFTNTNAPLWEAHHHRLHLLVQLTYFTKHFNNIVKYCPCGDSYLLVVLFGRLVRLAMLLRGRERTDCHHCCVFKKLSPSCFTDYQHCKLGNHPSAWEGLYTPAAVYLQFMCSATRCFNRILVFVVLVSLLVLNALKALCVDQIKHVSIIKLSGCSMTGGSVMLTCEPALKFKSVMLWFWISRKSSQRGSVGRYCPRHTSPVQICAWTLWSQ